MAYGPLSVNRDFWLDKMCPPKTQSDFTSYSPTTRLSRGLSDTGMVRLTWARVDFGGVFRKREGVDTGTLGGIRSS